MAMPGRTAGRLTGLGSRTVTILVALALVVAACDRLSWHWDLSEDHRFTISPSLVHLIHAQTTPIQLVLISRRNQADLARPVRLALDRMGAINPLVTRRHIDPELDKPLLAAFEARYHHPGLPGIYVGGSDRALAIPLTPATRETLQHDIGGALLLLDDPHPPLAVLLQGHGELRPGGGGEDGDEALVNALVLGGFRVLHLDLAQTGHIPAAAVLVLAGPTAPLGSDLALVEQHLVDGGSALILGDDRLPGDLCAWLRSRGVLMARGFPLHLSPDHPEALFDAKAPTRPADILQSLHHHLAGQESAFPYHNLLIGPGGINSSQAVTRDIARSGRSLISPWTTPVVVLAPQVMAAQPAAAKRLASLFRAAGIPPFTATPLLWTHGGDIWAKPRAAPLEEPPDLARAPSAIVAWALTSEPAPGSVRAREGARLVVWGSRQAASDAVLAEDGFANADFLIGACRHLAGQSPAQDIPPLETAMFQVQSSDGALAWIAGVLIAVMPCLALGAAMLCWWERR